MSGTERSARATRLLREAGIDASVSAAGQQGDIAAVCAPAEQLERIAAHASAIRALGFRYVALDIGAPDRTTV